MAADDLIAAFAVHLRELGRTERTIATYVEALTRADRDLPYGLDAAHSDELRAWIHREHLSPASRHTYTAAVRKFFSWATSAGLLDHDPARDLPSTRVVPGLPRVATDEQVARVLTEMADPYRLWAILAAFAGLRCVEVHRLHREDVSEAEMLIRRGKGGKPRRIPTHSIVWEQVRRLPAGRIADTDTAHQVSNRFIWQCRRLELPGLSMHRLRGWFATTTYRRTHDARTLMEVLGHANLGTTQVYVGVGEEARRALISSLEMPAGGASSGGCGDAEAPEQSPRPRPPSGGDRSAGRWSRRPVTQTSASRLMLTTWWTSSQRATTPTTSYRWRWAYSQHTLIHRCRSGSSGTYRIALIKMPPVVPAGHPSRGRGSLSMRSIRTRNNPVCARLY